MKQNNVILTVSDVMGWSRKDTLALNKWLNAYANLLGKNSEEKAVEIVKSALALEGDFPALDVNRWFYTVISLIYFELVDILYEMADSQDTNFVMKLKVNFAPIIQFAFSRFNNFMDDIDFEQSREKIVEQAMKLAAVSS